MRIDDIAKQSLLYDFYGALLTDRQREVMELYHEENLSLAEIADEMSISRQGVHDALKKAKRALMNYEQKLGLVERFQKTSDSVSEIDRRIDELIAGMQCADADGGASAGSGGSASAGGGESASSLSRELKKIKSIIDGIEQ